MYLHFSAEGMTTYYCVLLKSAFFSTTFKLPRFTFGAKSPKPHVLSPLLHLHSFWFIIASEFHKTCQLMTGGCDPLSCCIQGMCLCLAGVSSPEVPAPANRLGLPRTSPPACRHSHRRSLVANMLSDEVIHCQHYYICNKRNSDDIASLRPMLLLLTTDNG